MLGNDAPARPHLPSARRAIGLRRRRGGPGSPPVGTATYHCFRYDRAEHGLPTDADGTVILGLPVAARDWLKTPWRQYETGIWLEAAIAAAWLGDQLRAAASHHTASDPDTASGFEQQWRTCTAALDSRETACQTRIAFPGGNVLALAIVAVWDPDQTHPLLRGVRAEPEGSAR